MLVTEKPWGSFVMVKSPYRISDRDQICLKKILVNPGEELSLQSHDYRDEVWIVVRGIASVQLVHTFRTLGPGEMISIKRGKRHRLTNHHLTDPLIVLEVAIGQRLDEEDIKRYLDKYGRV